MVIKFIKSLAFLLKLWIIFPYLCGTMTTSVKHGPFSYLKWQCSTKLHLCLWLFCQSPSGSVVKNLPTVWELQETWVLFLGREDPLEEGTATHSSILAWRIPWTEDPGRLLSIGLQRIEHEWSNLPLLLLLLSCFSHVRLCATPEMAAHHASLSLGFSQQEHRSGLPFPSPRYMTLAIYIFKYIINKNTSRKKYLWVE